MKPALTQLNEQTYMRYRYSVQGRCIYWAVLIMVLAGLASLPLIRVDVGVQSNGHVRPVAERHPVLSPVSGHVARMGVGDNQKVAGRQELLRIASPAIDERIRYHAGAIQRLRHADADVGLLLAMDSTAFHESRPTLQTARYRDEFTWLRRELERHLREYRHHDSRYGVERELLQRQAITSRQYEQTRLDRSRAAAGYRRTMEGQRRDWSAAQTDIRDRLAGKQSELQVLERRRRDHTVRSPAAGTFQQGEPVARGSFVAANQLLGHVSPDTTLQVVAYVAPQDAGLLQPGMAARFRVEAYPHHQWGTVRGELVEVADDVTMVDGQPVYRVRSRLDRTWLELADGTRAFFRKGMSVHGRFLVARRSLFQLLFDKAGDWLNPS